MSKVVKIVGLVVIAAVLGMASLAVTTDTFAQGPGPDGPPDREGPLSEYKEDLKQALADVLGVTVDELEEAREEGLTIEEIAEREGVSMEDVQAALEAAWTDAVNQALADGVITGEQAERLLEAGPHRPGGRRPDPLAEYKEDLGEAVADALGITVDELMEARQEGLTIEEIAEREGVSMEDVQAALEAAWADVVNQALADGAITEEQAERLLEAGPHRPGAGRPNPLAEYSAQFEEALAAELGVSVDELNGARQSALETVLEQAVADGVIEQERADAILERIDENGFPRFFSGGHRPGGPRPGGGPGGPGGPPPGGVPDGGEG